MPRRRAPVPPKLYNMEVTITQKLFNRVQDVSKFTGLSTSTLLETGLVRVIEQYEREFRAIAIQQAKLDHPRTRARDQERDEVEYPYQCFYCPARFKLPIHRGRHISHLHPERRGEPAPEDTQEPLFNSEQPPPTPEQPSPEPEQPPIDSEETPSTSEVTPSAVEGLEDADDEPVEDRFKLAPGIDEDLLKQFDMRFNEPEPDTPEWMLHDVPRL